LDQCRVVVRGDRPVNDEAEAERDSGIERHLGQKGDHNDAESSLPWLEDLNQWRMAHFAEASTRIPELLTAVRIEKNVMGVVWWVQHRDVDR
jgi:hypothetical protein